MTTLSSDTSNRKCFASFIEQAHTYQPQTAKRITVITFSCYAVHSFAVMTFRYRTYYIGTLNISVYVTNDVQGVPDVTLQKEKDQRNLFKGIKMDSKGNWY